MKYFTKEELADITKELIENPTRETLKKLNDKYNGTTIVEPQPVVEMQNEVVEKNKEPSLGIAEQVVVSQPTLGVETLTNLNIQGIESSQTEPVLNNTSSTIEIPNLELPKLETPTFNSQNHAPLNFNGNLFETQGPSMDNLMQTTDNFNTVPNTMPSTEVPVAPAPFFVTSTEPLNNPIPVGGPINNMPVQNQSMFGQFEQNYM